MPHQTWLPHQKCTGYLPHDEEDQAMEGRSEAPFVRFFCQPGAEPLFFMVLPCSSITLRVSLMNFAENTAHAHVVEGQSWSWTSHLFGWGVFWEQILGLVRPEFACTRFTLFPCPDLDARSTSHHDLTRPRTSRPQQPEQYPN